MKTRTLGTDLDVAEVGLGCMTMTGGHGGSPDRSAMVDLIRSAGSSPWCEVAHPVRGCVPAPSDQPRTGR